MKKLIVVFLLIFLVLFTTSLTNGNYFWYESGDPIGAFSEKSARKLKAKYGWHPAGASVSSPEGVLKEVGIHFQVLGPKSQDEIRIDLIEASQELINDINNDVNLKQYLEYYPANEKNIEIVLFFVDKNRNEIKNPLISRASCCDGFLNYKKYLDVYDEKFKTHFPEKIWQVEETYEEALELVKKSQNHSLKYENEI